MVGDVLDTLGPVIRQNHNTLSVECGPGVDTMSADLMKTRQILINLLSNAGKFTRNGAIALDVNVRTIDGTPMVEFIVTDSGVGMTPEQTARIFDPFTQADVTTTRKYGGTGLGLAIVSRFCQLMGGRVTVQSRQSEGSRFVVHLPAAVVDATVESVAV
jgi:signal transduction histidine kinase